MIGAITAGLFSTGVAASTTAYESIATTVVGSGGTSTVTFSSIPSTYKHLQLRIIARSSYTNVQDYLGIAYNSDGGANYANHGLYGDGSTASALGLASQTENWIQRMAGDSATASVFGAAVIDILDYANTSKYKTERNLGGFDNNGSGRIYLASGLWQNTAAINRIDITSGDGASILQYSSFALYGIKG
jgi:hypothetical protein